MRVVTEAGQAIDLGTVETAPTIGITDFSRRVTDDFGVTTVVERGFSRTMSVRLGVAFDQVDELQRQLAALRATPATWIADDRLSWLSARGFYKEFSLDLPVPPLSYCTLTVEGLAEAATAADPGGDPAPEGQPSTLQLLQPVTVTDALLVASSVAEVDAPEWVADTIYPNGARVMRATTHRVYESVIAGNFNEDPAAASGKWLDVGATNRWAMFDQALGSATTAQGSITVTLDAGAIGAVALLDVAGETVRVQASGYDRTVAAGAGTITFLDLPGTVGQVTVTVTGAGDVSVGTLLAGELVTLGLTEASPTAGITDYSRKEVDDFGAVTVVQRAWAKRMTAKALIRTDAVDLVANRIAAVRAQPSLWIGQAGLDSLTVYGFFKEFSIEVGETVSKLSLSIEGLSAAAKVAPLGALVNWDDLADPTGTKPENNATNGADPTSPLGSGTVGDALTDLDSAAFNQALATAEAFMARQRDRALLYPGPNGESIYVLHKREVTDRQTANEAFSELFDMTLVLSPDGRSVLLKIDTVQITPGETLAQRFDSISASFKGQTATIDEFRQAVADDHQAQAETIDQITATIGEQSASIKDVSDVVVGPDGAAARAMNLLDVKGRVSGTVSKNNGEVAEFIVGTDIFALEHPVTGQRYLYADATGKLIAHDVEVDTLKVGTASSTGTPRGYSISSTFAGSGAPNGPMVTRASYTLSLPAKATVNVSMYGSQSYSGNADYGADVLVNGASILCPSAGGSGYPIPAFPGEDQITLEPGDHVFETRWRGSAGVTLEHLYTRLVPIFEG